VANGRSAACQYHNIKQFHSFHLRLNPLSVENLSAAYFNVLAGIHPSTDYGIARFGYLAGWKTNMSKITSNDLITIIGGSGFLGRQVVGQLAKTGARLRVAVRHPNEAMALRGMGSVGQIQIAQANIRNLPSLANAIQGASYVVNLVGTATGKGKQTFQSVHETGAENVAHTCAELGVTRLVHISAIGADVRSASAFSRTKLLGERAVTKAFEDATILRPGVMFGPEDKFFGQMAILAKALVVLPLVGGGTTKMQPVYVDDVAAAVCAALTNDETIGQTYELGGPRVWTLRDAHEFVLEATHRNRLLLPVPFGLAKFASLFLQMLPGHILRPDQVNQLREDSVVADDALTLNDLGITATPAEAIMTRFLMRYRKTGAYERDDAS
jgi:uncharacterized protein YbjT (DUF2867 family)